MIMEPQIARKDTAAASAVSSAPAARGCASATAEPGTTLDPLIFALSRAVDRLGPARAPGPRPDTAG